MRCLKWGREAGYLWANTGSHEPKSLDFGLVYSQIFQRQQDTALCSIRKEMRPATHLYKLWKFGSVNCYSRRKAVSHTATSVHFFPLFLRKLVYWWAPVCTRKCTPHTYTLTNTLHYSKIQFALLICLTTHSWTVWSLYREGGDSAMATKMPLTRVEWWLNVGSSNGKSN